jgi:hypothetical protein
MQFVPPDLLQFVIGVHRRLPQFCNLRRTCKAFLLACTESGLEFNDMVNLSITVTDKYSKTKEIASVVGFFEKIILVVGETVEPLPDDPYSDTDSDSDSAECDLIIKHDGTPIKPDDSKNHEHHGFITFCKTGKMIFNPHWIQTKRCHQWSVDSVSFEPCSKTAQPTSHIVLPGVQEHILMFNTKPFNDEVPLSLMHST